MTFVELRNSSQAPAPAYSIICLLFVLSISINHTTTPVRVVFRTFPTPRRPMKGAPTPFTMAEFAPFSTPQRR